MVKSTTREWADAISFAIIAATLIRWSIMEAFTIPTPSMEKSLLVGDFLFVSKFHYGTRTPMTPLQIPLTHQKVPVIESQSYLPWIQLPQYRLPGLTTVKNNDVVVFNWPASEDCPDCPIDLKTNYIKRCIGIGGDVVEVRDGQVYVNNEAAENPELMQHSYYVQTSSPIRERVFESLEISDPTYHGTREGTSLYTIHMSEAVATEMKNFDFVQVVKLDKPKKEDKDERIFPKGKDWNSDWYGPITLPKEGMTIEINEENLILYSMAIKNYEHNENVEIKDGKLIIDGKELTEYTFKQNYYFMMGDNRHNSLDSRYWGFVPEDHIVGKGFFIWLSLDKDKSFLSKIRWSRFFQMIE
ncbi:MAG: signal peptidase I [Cyclobacteriaceae bacterium]|nr:signal peptidase I [Cyclobacteriaceae bacterium]